MKIAFILFDGMTALDFVGVYDSVIRLKTMGFLEDIKFSICAMSDGVSDNNLLYFKPTEIHPSLDKFDIVIVPGGLGARQLVDDEDFIAWLKTAASCKIKTSVCTGALLLGAAGFLKGKHATTHRSAFNLLKKYCHQVVDEKIVEDGDVITSRGVTSSIDLGLYLCEKLCGREVREKIREQIDY